MQCCHIRFYDLQIGSCANFQVNPYKILVLGLIYQNLGFE